MFHRRFVVATFAALVVITLIAGCGGGGSDRSAEMSTAATSPWAGDYYCWTTGTTYSTVTCLFRVLSNGVINAVASGPYIRGAWTGTGTVTTAGAISLLVTNVQLNGGSRTDLTFAGQFAQPGGVKTPAGTLVRSIQPGTTLQWQGKPIPTITKNGWWGLTAAGTATTYGYNKAYAIIARANGRMGLSLIFDGTRTAWPAEGFVAVVDPGSVGLNVPKDTQAMGLLLGNVASTRYRNLTDTTQLPKITFKARDLRKGGYVTGSLTGKLRNYSDTADCLLNNVTFWNVSIIDDVTIN